MKSAEEQAIELLYHVREQRRVLDIMNGVGYSRDAQTQILSAIEKNAEALLASLRAENSRWCD